MTTPVLPDLLALGIEMMAAQATVSTAVGGRIASRVVGSAYPQIVVSVASDVEASPWSADGRIQYMVWGQGNTPANRQEVKGIARKIRSVARDCVGSWTAGKVTVAVGQTILDTTDPDTGQAGASIDVLVTAYP